MVKAFPGKKIINQPYNTYTMNQEHPNIAILNKFNPANVAEASDILAEDAIWHFFNPLLPDVQGDYIGLKGFQEFFERIGGRTDGTFKVNPVSATAIGDELVVVHSKNTMVMEDQPIEIDVVVVWRIVNGKITEAWDIPSVYTAQIKEAKH
ncbi:nuclear transport factor 2 family protein [Tunicatimonas pelagia]|uniref:nuclear transport factor 2 family protein n=1 Tax=Tunicatimonas pelagia TaxID=931531 RepID=UPI002665DFD7|nr:nuclear transport factor 2 family protein [Tunicatimonas pelagia]WKN41695.1 nuclear transport factor 2 family protein [Tunicatimonas pelagia]